jgi:hypothetical protein
MSFSGNRDALGQIDKMQTVYVELRERPTADEGAMGGCLFQISSNNLYQVVRGFLGGFGRARHVIPNVVFHQLSHQAVDGSSCRRQLLKHLRTRSVVLKSSLNGFKLAHHFLGAVHQIQLLSRRVGHFVDYPRGV